VEQNHKQKTDRKKRNRNFKSKINHTHYKNLISVVDPIIEISQISKLHFESY